VPLYIILFNFVLLIVFIYPGLMDKEHNMKSTFFTLVMYCACLFFTIILVQIDLSSYQKVQNPFDFSLLLTLLFVDFFR